MAMGSKVIIHTGSCLCGEVAFEITGPMKQVIGCHCSMCRKQTGHFLAYTAVWNDKFKLTKDATLKWYESSAHSRRGFCGTCGSVLFFARHAAEYISIAAGSMDGETNLAMVAHIFVADKGDYYEITDDCSWHDNGVADVQMPQESPANMTRINVPSTVRGCINSEALRIE